MEARSQGRRECSQDSSQATAERRSVVVGRLSSSAYSLSSSASSEAPSPTRRAERLPAPMAMAVAEATDAGKARPQARVLRLDTLGVAMAGKVTRHGPAHDTRAARVKAGAVVMVLWVI